MFFAICQLLKKEAIKMFEAYPDVVDVPTMAKMLKIGKNFAYELVNSGKIRCLKIGRKIRIPKVYIISYIKEN